MPIGNALLRRLGFVFATFVLLLTLYVGAYLLVSETFWVGPIKNRGFRTKALAMGFKPAAKIESWLIGAPVLTPWRE
jgi:hypothetical protein